ncbi:unnamed protein product [Zymoseptoria tritici ST99CH_3D7]|uniref:Uncharacterized protein n=2 Tax=Zymoseptoria tritici TaxID=1047171 RepID=A0A1X7S660_ZYMT9|nr:unnamed protein product [Zymoseptoria tritici ST99CH_3D7]SMR59157.1 unnamed protein product [Zymoseptoria tritici ST99CH_1E4]
MGLFVAGDGHYKGWLAALLCCCAAVTEDEYPVGKRRERSGASPSTVCYTQPTIIKSMISRPRVAVRSIHSKSEAGSEDSDCVRPSSERPPSLKPLDLGETPFFSRMSLPSLNRDSWGTSKRISIGPPTAFRRVELTEQQRASLIPLGLDPAVLREFVVIPQDDEPALSYATSKATDSQRNSFYNAPSPRHGKAISITSLPASAASTIERTRNVPPTRERMPNRPMLAYRSSSGSIRSLRRQVIDVNAAATASRHSIDWARLGGRRRADSRNRSMESNNLDIDREILELNTIVEERRAEGLRSSTPDTHVSAVAPLMSIRARSQTLTAIGSAFSRPLPVTTENTPQQTPDLDTAEISPITQRLSRPFTLMPDQIPTLAAESTTTVRSAPTNTRVNGWLSSLFPSIKPDTAITRDTFYACSPPLVHQRVVSTASTATVTESDSPSDPSSAFSKHHSRSITEVSAMTPTSSPPSSAREWKRGSATVWAVEADCVSPTKVGLAF